MLEIQGYRKPSVSRTESKHPGQPVTEESVSQAAGQQGITIIRPGKQDSFEYRNPVPDAAPERPKNFINNFRHNMNGLCVEIHKTLSATFKGYFTGDVDEDMLFRTVDRTVSSLMNFYEGQGFDPKEIVADVIEDTYNLCRSYVVHGAYDASCCEAKEICRQLGCKSSYIYYNSDLHYKSEELIDRLYAHMQDLAEESGGGPANFPRDFPAGDQRNQFFGSYNSRVNTHARNSCGSFIDENMIPPRGFRMFFDSNGTGTSRYSASMGAETSPESFFDGAVYIQYQGWSFSHRVPIRMDPTRFHVSVHLLDVIKGSGKEYPLEIEDFLNNFDFFAMNVGKMYTDAHPRNYWM